MLDSSLVGYCIAVGTRPAVRALFPVCVPILSCFDHFSSGKSEIRSHWKLSLSVGPVCAVDDFRVSIILKMTSQGLDGLFNSALGVLTFRIPC